MIDAKILFLVAAVVVGFMSFRKRKRKDILMCLFATNCILSMRYLLSGAIGSVIINVFDSVRNLTYAQKDAHKFLKLKIIPYGFCMAILVLGVLVWNGPLTILFVAGNLIKCIGMNCTRTTYIRRSGLAASLILLVYEIISYKVIGVCYELILIISAVSGLFKYRRHHHGHHSHR